MSAQHNCTICGKFNKTVSCDECDQEFCKNDRNCGCELGHVIAICTNCDICLTCSAKKSATWCWKCYTCFCKTCGHVCYEDGE